MLDATSLHKEFLALLRTPGPSGEEMAVCAYLKSALSTLGFACETDETGNLSARLGASGGHAGGALLFCAHMDTVPLAAHPVIVETDAEYRTDGTTALGADDRGGIAAILAALRQIAAEDAPHPPIELLFTVQEERSLYGSAHADLSRFAAREAFVPDSSRSVGTAVLQTPYKAQLDIAVRGRAAHAALALEAGVSAIRIAARAIDALPAVFENATFNVGSFCCEGPTNVVPDSARLRAEARAFEKERLDAVLAQAEAAFVKAAAELGGLAECASLLDYPGYAVSANHPAVLRVRAACEKLGFPFSTCSGMGGSDANHLVHAGIAPVVLGTGARAPHAPGEHMEKSSLERLAALLFELMTGGNT